MVLLNQYNQVLNFYTFKIPSWSTIIMSQFNSTSFFKHTIGTVISLMNFIITNTVDLCKVALARSIYIYNAVSVIVYSIQCQYIIKLYLKVFNGLIFYIQLSSPNSFLSFVHLRYCYLICL